MNTCIGCELPARLFLIRRPKCVISSCADFNNDEVKWLRSALGALDWPGGIFFRTLSFCEFPNFGLEDHFTRWLTIEKDNFFVLISHPSIVWNHIWDTSGS